MKTAFIFRALPGVGKSTIAKLLAEGFFHRLNLPAYFVNAKPEDVICSADDYFYEDGEYKFNPARLPEVHGKCFEKFTNLITKNAELAIVDNTNVEHWQYAEYKKLAEDNGYQVHIIDLFDGGFTDEQLFKRNKHGVPLAGLKAMREGYEK